MGTNWTVDQRLQSDISLVFDNDSALYRILDTNPKSWSKMKSNQGVKQSTAQNIVKDFFQLLSNISDGDCDEDDIHRDVAKRLFEEKYKVHFDGFQYSQFVTEIV